MTRSPERAEKTGPSEPALPEYPELSVIQMLADPIVRALMIADGVRVGELEALLSSTAKRLRAGNSLRINSDRR